MKKNLLSFITMIFLWQGSVHAQLFIPVSLPTVGGAPRGIATGDFNGDGLADIAVANSGTNNVSVLLGKGDGTFLPSTSYVVESTPWEVVTADYNMDGKTDLAVINSGSNTVSILLGNGNGTFNGQGSFPVLQSPLGIVNGDFNKDGKTDIAVSDFFSNTLSVIYGNGDGSFSSPLNLPVGRNPQDIITADFDGDGNLDLADPDAGDPTLSILLGNGNGTFQNVLKAPLAAAGADGITTADFNGDGKLDLAAADTYINGVNNGTPGTTVSVLLGNGNGTFTAPVNYTAGTSPRGVFSGDYNMDGKTDLATVNMLSDNISILLGNGDGTFAPALNFPVKDQPRILASADFNGDGKLDLAVPDFGGTVVNVFLNNILSGTVTTTPQSCTVAGSLSITPAGGNAPYLYSIDGVNYVATSVFTGLNAGTYNAMIKDANGSVFSKLVTISLTPDVTNPVAAAKDITIQLDAAGLATADPASVNNGSTDNCSIKTLSLSQTHFDCTNIGPNNVVLTVTDASGNAAGTTAVITVTDTIRPVARAKNVTVQLNAAGKATLLPSDVNNGSTDNCSIAAFTLNKTTFTGADLGNTAVTLTVTDPSGNNASANAIVTIQDTIKPVVHTKNITVALDPNGNAVVPPSAVNNGSTDNSGIKNVTLSKSVFTCADLGPNTVTLTITDISGNTSGANAVITVTDTILPVTRTKNIFIALDASGNASITPASVDNGSTDNCSIKTLSLNKTGFNCTQTGANTVILTATDASGNSSSATAIVTVADNIKPVAVTKNITVQLDITGSVTITPESVDNGSYDNCGISGLSLDKTNFTCAQAGINTVLLTVTDVNGNSASSPATVTILNNSASLNITLTSPQVIAGYNTSCNSAPDGSVSLSVTGGKAPYSVLWNTGETSYNLTNLYAGSYTVTVKDKNGCSAAKSIQLTRPENCGCNPVITVPAASTFGCTRSLDGSSNPIVNGETACINGNFTGNISFYSGTLVIAGNATISALNIGANSKLVVLGTLTVNSISANGPSASIINYGTLNAGSIALGNGQWSNYGKATINGGVNLNPQGKLINQGPLTIKYDITNGQRIENYALLTVGGSFNNNSNSVLINQCTIHSGYMVSNQGVQFQNSGTISVSNLIQFNGTTSLLGGGSITRAAGITTGGSSFTNKSAACALITVSNTASMNQTVFSGLVSFCDTYTAGISTSNVQFNNGATMSCKTCSYSGSLTNGKLAASDLSDIQDQNAGIGIGVYPNPAQESAMVTLSSGDFSYKVLSMQGTLVQEGRSSGQEALLHLENAAAGIYVIEITDGQNNNYVRKLVVRK